MDNAMLRLATALLGLAAVATAAATVIAVHQILEENTLAQAGPPSETPATTTDPLLSAEVSYHSPFSLN